MGEKRKYHIHETLNKSSLLKNQEATGSSINRCLGIFLGETGFGMKQ